MKKTESIKVSKLLLDLGNPRFNKEVYSQKEAINLMLELQGDKIIRLAEDMIKNGLDPSENMIVYPDLENNDFYIVAEGNRRTTALKLLEQPTISNINKYKNKFQKLEQLHKKEPLTEVNCVIIPNEEEYEHWVSLKHTGDNKGVGRERWTTPEIDRYNAKHGKVSIQSQLYKVIIDHSEEYKNILELKQFIHATNLSRLFDSSTQKVFGLITNEGYLYSTTPYEEFLEKLRVVLESMTYIAPGNSKPDFSVSRIYDKDARKEFLSNLGIFESDKKVSAWKLDDAIKYRDELINDTKNLSQSGIQSNTSNSTESNAESKTDSNDEKKLDEKIKNKRNKNNNPNPNRNNLIPMNIKLFFGKNNKCNSIFNELKSKLIHSEQPYSISVMLRVFIDLSVSDLIEKKKIKFHSKDKSGQDRTPGLYDKVQLCSNYLKDTGLLTQTQVSALNAFAKDKLVAKGTLQQYVHNQHIHPSRDIVNREWDNFFPLLEAIWSEKIQSNE